LHPTYIDDVIQGLEITRDKQNAVGEIYNIAGPRVVSVEEYVRSIAQILGVSIPHWRIPKMLACEAARIFETISKLTGKEPFVSKSKIEFLTQSHGSNISKAQRQLGYKPKFDLQDGMEKTITWYRNKGLI
jgi:nucleoside-diphosphate-sugar epimerase